MSERVFVVKFKIEYEWFEHSAGMINENEMSGVLSARLRKLDDHYFTFSSAYEKILNIITDEKEIQIYDDKFKITTIHYNRLEVEYAKISDENSKSQNMTSEMTVHSRLPVIDLHNFDGNIFEWCGFISLFESLVLNRKDLSKTEKYHYLFSHVHKEPRTLIQHLSMTNESLDTALDLLKSRYEIKRMLTDKYLGRLIYLPIVSNQQNLRAGILNPLLECTRALKNLGLAIDNYMTLYIVLSKLPVGLKTRFEQKHGGIKNELPKFENLVDFLQDECYFIDTVLHSEASQSIQGIGGIPVHGSGEMYIRNKPRAQIGCAFCSNKSHKVFDCYKFNNSTCEDRRTWVRANGLCFRCFGNHSAVSCSRNVPCTHCGNTGHHKLICTFTAATREPVTYNKNYSFNNAKPRNVTVGATVDNNCNLRQDSIAEQQDDTPSTGSPTGSARPSYLN